MIIVWMIYSLLTVIKVHCQCGGSTSVSSVGYKAVTINSPNYDNGYSTNLQCSWSQTTSVSGSSLLAQVNASVDCSGDGINIYDGTDNTGSSLYTCTTTTPSYLVGSSGSLYTSFITDSISDASKKGFTYNVIAARDLSGTACTSPMTLKASTTVNYISSPSFPNLYPPNSLCTWTIERSSTSNQLELSFKFIDIEYEASGPCNFDYVQIQDDATGTTVLTTCGTNVWNPTQTYTTNGNVTVTFRSDQTQHMRGFLLSYSVLSSSTSSSGADDDACFLGNCVVLPVLITIGGVFLIIIIAGIIICIVSKTYVVPKNVSVSVQEPRIRKLPSLRQIIIPKFGLQQGKSARDIFETMEESIISAPPIATQGIRNTSPKNVKRVKFPDTKVPDISRPENIPSNANDVSELGEIAGSSYSTEADVSDVKNNKNNSEQSDSSITSKTNNDKLNSSQITHFSNSDSSVKSLEYV